MKTEREGASDLSRFCQNLLNPSDLSRLRQIVISLVSRLLPNALGSADTSNGCSEVLSEDQVQ